MLKNWLDQLLGLNNLENDDGSIALAGNEIEVGAITDAQHGIRGATSAEAPLHPYATESDPGFMSAADKTRLDELPTFILSPTVTTGDGTTVSPLLTVPIPLGFKATIKVHIDAVCISGTDANKTFTGEFVQNAAVRALLEAGIDDPPDEQHV